MANKLHVAKTYKVEWGETESFPHGSYEFRRLLNELNVPVSSMADDYLDFEVLKTDWRKAINTLGAVNNMTELMVDILKEYRMSKPELVKLFKQYLKEAEPDDEWLHFSFF